jgi:hypothetical protein
LASQPIPTQVRVCKQLLTFSGDVVCVSTVASETKSTIGCV